MPFAYRTELTTPNRWAGSNTRRSITAHWWGEPKNYPTGDAKSVAEYLCRPSAQASAHFVVSGKSNGRGAEVYCLAACSDRTWHSGSTQGNASSIGIELCPLLRPEDIEAAAELLAVLFHWYPSLKGKALRPHSSWVPTTCPGDWKARLDRVVARAVQLMPYVDPNNPGKAKGSAPIAHYPKTPGSSQVVAVDKWIGTNSTKALQKLLGTPQDGILSGQATANKPLHVRLTSATYSSRAEGSQAVVALQRKLGGLTADGHLGPASIKRWQTRLGVTPDGYLGPDTAHAIQTALNNGKLW